MKYRLIRLLSTAMLLAFAVVVLIPAAAFASVEGRRNTTYALGAVALYSVLKGNNTTALVTGAGAYYAYQKWNDAKEEEERRQRRQASYRKFAPRR